MCVSLCLSVYMFVCICVSLCLQCVPCITDGASSDTSSYELEQPSLVRFIAADHQVPRVDTEVHHSEAAGHATGVEEDPQRYVSSTKLATGPSEGPVADVEKPQVHSDDLIGWADDSPRAEPAWLDVARNRNMTNSHTSLLSADM